MPESYISGKYIEVVSGKDFFGLTGQHLTFYFKIIISSKSS